MTTLTGTGLAPVRVTLSNGATVLVKTSPTTPAVTIAAMLRAGSICDPEDGLGLVNLFSKVLDRGTTRRSASEIAELLDARGVSLNVSVTRHTLGVTCTCLSADFQAVLEVVADIIRDAACPDDEIQTRRGEMLTGIRQDDDNPAVRAVERLMALLYGARHPYGRPSKGTLETVNAISRDDLLSYHRRFIVPSALTLVVVGDVGADHAVDLATRVLGDWPAADPAPQALPTPERHGARQRVVLPMMNKAQADIAYGFTTIVRSDPAYYAYWVMNHILGQYGMGGRLGQSIREQQGMAYYAFSSFEANVLPGPLLIRAGVSGANVDRAVGSIDAEVARLAAEGVSDRELADSKRYLIGSLPRTLETNAGIAAFLQAVEQFDLGLDYDVRLPGLLEAVTRDEVADAARATLAPERACLVIAGPYGESS
jgi:zinc protease